MSLQFQLVAGEHDPHPIEFELDDATVRLIDRLVGTGFGIDRAEVIRNVLEHSLNRNESIGR